MCMLAVCANVNPAHVDMLTLPDQPMVKVTLPDATADAAYKSMLTLFWLAQSSR